MSFAEQPTVCSFGTSIARLSGTAFAFGISILPVVQTTLCQRPKDLARDIERKLDDHEVGKLLTTISHGVLDGIRPRGDGTALYRASRTSTGMSRLARAR